MANNNNRPSTSTQIRNMYSEGVSCLNIKFYNTNLSFQLYPFNGKDQNGRSQYDSKHGQQTTVNFEGAYALYQTSKDILDGKINETNLSVPCLGASLTLERKLGVDGEMETVFSITKNNVTIPFKFQTIKQQVKENGNIMTRTIESGLGAFMMTIEGYLTGINADRHLDKLTDDYAKLNENGGNKNGGQNQQGAYNKQYNNNNYRRPNSYNNNNQQYNNRPKQNNSYGGPSQSFDSYQVPN